MKTLRENQIRMSPEIVQLNVIQGLFYEFYESRQCRVVSAAHGPLLLDANPRLPSFQHEVAEDRPSSGGGGHTNMDGQNRRGRGVVLLPLPPSCNQVKEKKGK